MDFDLTEDQALIASAVRQIVARHLADPTSADFVLNAPVVERELTENGFLGATSEMGLGPVEGLLIAEEVGRLPFAIEAATSGILGRAILDAHPVRRPLAVALAPADGPIRYLQGGGAAVIITDDDVRLLQVEEQDVERVPAVFAYPFGRFRRLNVDKAVVLEGVAPESAKQWWRVVIAAEIGVAGRAALEATVEFVKQRRQFNRAIGSFQAVQHRLAHVATLVQGIEWLTRRAATSGAAADAALAATMAQQSAGLIHADCTQFHGAYGTTLDCPLHFWAYRLRALRGELKGLSHQSVEAARSLWPDAVAKQSRAVRPA
ncbi:MAG: hypothetical protein JO127_11500 [Caulobacteraceae bacterium]|nr:hypothetical protein [Caulobacteraceae bacterium]